MTRHRPADDLAAVEVHDRGQIKPTLISLDVGDVGEPDLVPRGGGAVWVKALSAASRCDALIPPGTFFPSFNRTPGAVSSG
jgi:hypothetical protein